MRSLWHISITILAILLPVACLNFELNFLTNNSLIYFLVLLPAADLLFLSLINIKELQTRSLQQKIFFYLKLILLCVVVVVSLQLLKLGLDKKVFYQILIVFILLLVINKLKPDSNPSYLNLTLRFCYYFLITMISWQIIATPWLVPASLISIRNTLLLMAFVIGLNTNHDDYSWKYRLCPLTYFLFLLVGGLTIILELTSPLLGFAFLAVPLVSKLANQHNLLSTEKYNFYNKLLLFIFLAIMLFSDLYG